MKHEPTPLEIFLTKLAFLLYGKSVYKAFSDRLPLNGDEQVLDFGCGMGTVAFYVAKKIPRGHLTCLDISRRWLKTCRKTLRGYKNISFLSGESQPPTKDSFDVAYCHFVLHDIPERELEKVIPALAGALKSGGALVFREPFKETKKIALIKSLAEQNRLIPKDSRITDVPLMGNSLECIYIKQ